MSSGRFEVVIKKREIHHQEAGYLFPNSGYTAGRCARSVPAPYDDMNVLGNQITLCKKNFILPAEQTEIPTMH